MSTYYAGDIPAEALPVVPSNVDLTLYTGATVELIQPDGIPSATPPTAEIVNADIDPTIEITWSDDPVLEQPGLYLLRITLTNAAFRSRRLPALSLVVQAEDGWHNLDSARETDWPDARDMADLTLWNLLETARHDVIEFAPVLAEGAPIPAHYRMAQIMQARNRWNAALADPTTGDIVGEGFAIPARPLDWQVKQLLRPTTARPATA